MRRPAGQRNLRSGHTPIPFASHMIKPLPPEGVGWSLCCRVFSRYQGSHFTARWFSLHCRRLYWFLTTIHRLAFTRSLLAIIESSPLKTLKGHKPKDTETHYGIILYAVDVVVQRCLHKNYIRNYGPPRSVLTAAKLTMAQRLSARSRSQWLIWPFL